MAAIGEATPKVGKTHAKHCRLILDELNLSGVSRQVGSLGVEYEATDITGYGDGVHYFTLGQATHLLNGYQAAFSNLASVGSHTELKDFEEYIASFCIGVRGVPEIGSVAWLSSVEQMRYDVQGADAPLVNVDFVKAITDNDHTNPWGVVLSDGGQAFTATVANAGVDNEAATTNGFVAHLHVLATAAGDYAFNIETSSDDGDGDAYANAATFTADGSALTSERIDVAGAVERYVRLNAVRTAGTCTAWVTMARGINLDA